MSLREPAVIVGRDRELSLLRSLLAGVIAGRGDAVLVEGQPGIGKSALLDAGLAGAAEAGCQVYRAVADELSQRLPLRVLARVLGTEPAAPVQPAPDRSAPGAAGDPVLAMVERLLVFVEGRCARSPVVLVLDDLQWADDYSLLAWSQLAGAVRQVPLLLVAAARTGSGRDEVMQLRRTLARAGHEVIRLEPLADEAATELAARIAGTPIGPRLRELTGRAGGNPLYVRELVDALVRDGTVQVRPADPTDQPVGVPGAAVAELAVPSDHVRVPRSLAAAIADRLEYLSEPTVRILRIATLFGAEFSVADLIHLADRPVIDLLGEIEEATRAGILTEAGPSLAFRHPLIRQALYQAMPENLRSALHHQAARALADSGAPPDRVAAQLLAAPDLGPFARQWLARHSAELVRTTPAVAAELLERAVAGASGSARDGEQLEADLATANFLLARHDRAIRAARRVLARTTDPAGAAQATWTLAYSLARTGRPAEADEAIAAGLGADGLPAAWRARLGALHAMVSVLRGRYGEGAALAERVLAETRVDGDGIAAGYAHHSLSMVRRSERDHAGALRHVEEGLRSLGDDPDTDDLRILLMVNRVVYQGLLDHWAEAAEAAAEVRTAAERSGTSREGMVRLVVAQHLYNIGSWDDALTELEVAGRLPDETQWDALHGIAALIHGHRNNRGLVRERLRQVSKGHPSAGVYRSNTTHLLMAKALATERAGDLRGALDLLVPTLDPAYARDVDHRHQWLPDLVRLAMDLAAPDTAAAATRACRDEAELEPLPVKLAAARHCEGLLTRTADPLLEAAAYHRRIGRKLQLGQTLEDAAVLLAAQDRSEEARPLHAEAVEVYADLGASWDIMRADARLRPFGVRRGVRGRRRRPTIGWQALTPTELRVATLVANGRSTPDIATELYLSHRTVQTHISHILGKLGVRSRQEIAGHATMHA